MTVLEQLLGRLAAFGPMVAIDRCTPRPDAPAGAATPIAERLVRLGGTTGARVTFIEDLTLLADVGGVGAVFCYRIQPVAPQVGPTLQGTI